MNHQRTVKPIRRKVVGNTGNLGNFLSSGDNLID